VRRSRHLEAIWPVIAEEVIRPDLLLSSPEISGVELAPSSFMLSRCDAKDFIVKDVAAAPHAKAASFCEREYRLIWFEKQSEPISAFRRISHRLEHWPRLSRSSRHPLASFIHSRRGKRACVSSGVVAGRLASQAAQLQNRMFGKVVEAIDAIARIKAAS